MSPTKNDNYFVWIFLISLRVNICCLSTSELEAVLYMP